MGHDEDGPLRATYRTERPPWIGLWSGREYKGRVEWWAEPGMTDRVLRAGRFRGNRDTIKEESAEFFDPEITPGKSLSGTNGLDSTRYQNNALKGDTPVPLAEFQQNLMKNSLQYKQIAEKYNLSPEHPGLDVNPNMDTLRLTPVNRLGIGSFIPTRYMHFGPRFFDKPLNKGTHEKVFAAAKYTAVFMVPMTLAEIKATRSISVRDFTPKLFVRRYFQLLPIPMALATGWAFSISASAAIRNKDDCYNHGITAIAMGALVATIKDNFFLGTAAALATGFLGCVWQYQRASEVGLTGRAPNQYTKSTHGGPLAWQLFQGGSLEVPDRVF